MYLKRVDITGFKSFTERTRLYLEQGITAIVGPNGCGKSNVVDAIRWCLGEQSTRSIRCHTMLDLIFNGSQKRSPMGMAEVSLVFDNTSNKIPLDFNEIIVTRKLFRSGESEYYLNKVQCRMKDIRDLFLDTGIGYEGYSIMEQGKVEFILNAKPEERRELFEEAAGVSKYKVRREEALRKMERLEFDLTRIQDTIAIVKDQIRQLDIAVRKAKQYQSGVEELKKLEISDYLHQKQELKQSVENIADQLAKQQDMLAEKTSILDKQDARIEELRLTLSEKEQAFSRAQGDAYRIDSEIALSESRSESSKKKIAYLEQRKEQLTRDVSAESIQIESMIKSYAGITQELNELSVQLYELATSLHAREEECNSKTMLIETRHAEWQSMKNDLLEQESVLTGLYNMKTGIESRISRISGEMHTLQKEYAKKAEHDIMLEGEADEVKQKYETIRNQLKHSTEEETLLRARIDETEQKLAGYRQQDDAINQQQLKRCARLSALAEQMETDPYHRGTLALLERQWKGIIGPLHRLVHYPEEYRQVVADAFGGHLDYFVSETINEAEEAIQYLKDNEKGRARFFILETLPNDISLPLAYMTSEKPVLDIIQYDSRISMLLRYLLQSSYYKGSTIYRDHIIEGGGDYTTDRYALGSGTLKEKDTLESALHALSENRKNIQEMMSACAGQIEGMQAQLSEADDVVRQNQITHRVMEADVQKTLEEKRITTEELHILHQDIQTFFDEKKDLQHQIAEFEKQCSSNESTIRGMRASLEGFEKELASLQTTMSEVTEKTNAIRVLFSQFQERVEHKKTEKDRQERFHLDLSFNHVFKGAELQVSEQKINEEHLLIERERQRIDELFKQKEQQDVLVKQEAEEKNRLQDELHGIITQVHEIRQDVSTMRTLVQNTEIEHERLMFREQSIVNQLHEKYNLSLEQAQQQFEVLPLDRERAEKLRSRILSLGSVNLAAPEEYEQLEGRYTFLQKQYQDIIQAKEDLKKVIQRINGTTKENFEKTFLQVQENFQNIYRTLFQGGEAKLTLTNEENLLETGVDIFAQPPGKKLQNISLLSGGEKALTASALLFAFFMVRPSPICILDEVDAPLDEANVGRFIRMIKDFSKETQFVIITHNKRTMEIADTLYGVTMEEYGVSKVISIKFTVGTTEPISEAKENAESAEELPAIV